MIEVVPLTHRNAGHVVTLGADMHAASSFKNMAFCPNELADFLDFVIEEDALTGFLAYEASGTAVGLILCSVTKSFFGPDLLAGDIALYVDPSCRARGAAKQLTQAYVDWAVSKGARRVSVGNSAGAPDQAYTGLMEGLGFTKTGSLLCRNV